MNCIEQAMTDYWGERCDSYEQGCVVCDAWNDYDALVNHELAHARVRRNLMLEEMTRPPIDPELQKQMLKIIFEKNVGKP
jgi:hypothetical protein